MARPFFSGSLTSEASMGNPNTAEEKKSKIEQENQENKSNQRKMGLNNSDPEFNPLGMTTGLDIGDVRKSQLEEDPLTLEKLEGYPVIGKSDVSKEGLEIISQDSGLDDPILEKQGKGKSENPTKSNKLGSNSTSQLTGIPKYQPPN